MTKNIFVAFGHHNTKNSFNASVRDTFIEEAKKCGHSVDLINLHDENQLQFLMVVRQMSKYSITEKD